MAFDVDRFDDQVVLASNEYPIVVDFWAAWCGPCRVVGPILENLETRSGGTWRLAKVDVDHHQDVAARFGIQSIPAVKMFHNGQVVAEFVGALPEAAVRSWLDENLPSRAKELLMTAETLIDKGELNKARSALQRILSESDHPKAKIMLARLTVLQKPDEAAALLRDLDDPDAVEILESVELLKTDVTSLPDGDAQQGVTAGLMALTSGNYDVALQSLIDTLSIDKNYSHGIARRLCIAIFKSLGDGHPLTIMNRPRFSMALH